MPTEKGSLFALGVSGPTFQPTDGIRHASENGRAQLAVVVASQLETLLVAKTVASRTKSETNTEEILHESTEMVLRLAETTASWQDADGKHSGVPGTTYALVRIDKSRVGAAGVPCPVPAKK